MYMLSTYVGVRCGIQSKAEKREAQGLQGQEQAAVEKEILRTPYSAFTP